MDKRNRKKKTVDDTVCEIHKFSSYAVLSNREKKKITRYYIDEFHLLLKEEQTAKYSAEIWKRFRKWGGVPTQCQQLKRNWHLPRKKIK